MYCPQCGDANDDGAAFCKNCGMDLNKYKEQWSEPPAAEETRAPGDKSPNLDPRWGEGWGEPANQPPPYEPQHQPGYQAPPYQTGPGDRSGGYHPPAGYPPNPYQPGYGYQPGYNRGMIPNIPSYMGWAIATLILCFWPTGIVAVVHASRVGNRLALGDVAGAQESSRKAKTWTWVTFAIGLAGFVIAIIVAIVAASAAVSVIGT